MNTRPTLFDEHDLPPVPQQQRSRKKRDALLDAALALFAAQGFEATTIEDIAHHAGAAVGGFYQYFRSKQQLLLVLMDNLLTEIEALGFGDAPTDDVRAVIHDFLRRALSADLRYVGAYRAWREVSAQDARLRALNAQIEAWMTARTALMLRLLAQMPGARAQVNVDVFARVLSVLFLNLIVTLDAQDVEAVIATTTDMIYRTLFA